MRRRSRGRLRDVAVALAAVLVLLAGGCTSGDTPDARSDGQRAVASRGAAAPASPPAPLPAPVRSPLPADRVAALQAVLDTAVADHALTHFAGARGMTAAVLSDRGAWAGAAGVDGLGRTLRPNAMMAVDSITKTFVAAEVMRLAEAGRVDLDAPLARYVRHPLTANGATVRDVLGMRSGVTDPPERSFWTLARARAAHPGRPWTLRRTLAALGPRAAAATGGDPVYANANYLLLGMLVERVTGRDLARVEHDDLFVPAGLGRVVAQGAARPSPPLGAAPRRFVPAPDGYLPSLAWARSGHDAFSGIAADAATLAAWGYELYGARLLEPESVRAMTTPTSVGGVGPGLGYGLGTMVLDGLSTVAAFGHVGQDPGYTSLLAVLPARRLSVAVLVPDRQRNVVAFTRDLLAALS